VLVNVLDGLISIDKDLLNLARIMNGGHLRTFLVIRLPAAIGPLFSGLKIGATYAIVGAVIGEWTASNGKGLGAYIQTADAALNSAGVYGSTLLLTAVGVLGFVCVLGLEHLATPWTYRGTARNLTRIRSGRAPAAAPLTAPVAAADKVLEGVHGQNLHREET
ncbi:MAG: ABC transporter permease, partial [Candidatus Saccharimonadales bacterium]